MPKIVLTAEIDVEAQDRLDAASKRFRIAAEEMENAQRELQQAVYGMRDAITVKRSKKHQ